MYIYAALSILYSVNKRRHRKAFLSMLLIVVYLIFRSLGCFFYQQIQDVEINKHLLACF